MLMGVAWQRTATQQMTTPAVGLDDREDSGAGVAREELSLDDAGFLVASGAVCVEQLGSAVAIPRLLAERTLVVDWRIVVQRLICLLRANRRLRGRR